MASWLSISFPNPFKITQSDDEPPLPSPENTADDRNPLDDAGGVTEDLSVFGQTIGRQIRGVAAFLAPPPPSQLPSPFDAADDASSSQALVGIRNDLVEIGGTVKSGLSLLATNKTVSEISRFASNLLQFQNLGPDIRGDGNDEASGGKECKGTSEVAGVSEEILDFVREISLRPECWTDFPFLLDNDFVMSDAQTEHALTVESLVPTLVTLRHELLRELSDEQFWMIYFILLLPRLREHDLKLLSTPEVVVAREGLMKRLQKKRDPQVATNVDPWIMDSSEESGKVCRAQRDSSPFQGKEVFSGPVNATQGIEINHENIDRLLDKEDVDTCTSLDAQKHSENEEDVSFSDLEDDNHDLSGRISGFNLAQDDRISTGSVSNEWVRLSKNSETQDDWQKTSQSTSKEKDSEGEESNDWLAVDDSDDLDSSAAI